MSAEGMNSVDQTSGGTVKITARLLRRFLPGEARLILIGFAIVLAASGAALLQPWPLKLVVDCVVGTHPAPQVLREAAATFAWLSEDSRMRTLAVLCLALLLIEVVQGGMNVFSAYLLNSVALRMVFKLRCTLFNHVQRLSLGFHDSAAVGDSLYRITWDSYCIQSIFSEGLVPGLTAATTLAGIGVIMFVRDWRITLAAMAVALPLVFLIRRLDKPLTEQSSRVHEYESEVSTRVQETLVGIKAVQAYGREDFESRRFETQASASLGASLRLTVVQTASQALVGLVLAAGTAGVIWLGARGALQGRMTAGDLVLLAAYIAMIFKPIETLAYTAGAIQNATAGGRRVLKLLDAIPEVSEAPTAIDLRQPVTGNIRFEQVSFGYRRDCPVLHDVDLEIPARGSLALVGTSGGGKTTLASLMLRFYDPSAGRITIDGQDLRELTLRSLRESIALVTQDPILFAATIRENIAYGLPGATQEQIEEAARAAGAHEFITELSEKYETRIAERGTNLSGGQRQRIAIARAFLKNAPVLILDEPTSALDARTEEALVYALRRLMSGRTTLIIAHRLSTVRCAERIAVIQDGRICESGTQEELLRLGGHYARLHQFQFGIPSEAEHQLAI
jgi:ATP-binding cassette, subfamily B, bacterial